MQDNKFKIILSAPADPPETGQNCHLTMMFLQKSEKENCLSFSPPITEFEGRLQWESSIFNGLYNTLDSRLPAGRQVSTGMTIFARGSIKAKKIMFCIVIH